MVYHLSRISDSSPIRAQMTYSSNIDAVTKCFSGLTAEFKLNNIGDVDYDTLADEVERKA